jgi:hypothetical protein
MNVCRPRADPWRVTNQPDPATLRTPASVFQVPISVDDQLEGVVDLV